MKTVVMNFFTSSDSVHVRDGGNFVHGIMEIHKFS